MLSAATHTLRLLSAAPRTCSLLQPPSTAPILSADKEKRKPMPLDFLEERWAIDPSTKWRRK